MDLCQPITISEDICVQGGAFIEYYCVICSDILVDTSNQGGQEVAGKGGEGEERLDDRGRDGDHADAAAGAGRVPGPRGRDPAESPLRQPDRGGHSPEEGAGGGAGRAPGQVWHVNHCQTL